MELYKPEKKGMKLNNNKPSLFEKIPSEILLIIIQYLTNKLLIAWNGGNKRFYETSIQKIMETTKFQIIW